MLVAAALCPCPPLLVPAVAAGAAPELAALRAACLDVTGVLAAARPDRLVVLGPADEAGRGPHPQGARGSFRGFGVDLEVRLGAAGATPERELPPSLSVGAWLLSRAEWAGAPVDALGVAESLPRDHALSTGRELAASAPRVALLVMGDGSACRTVKAPGYFDERAEAFDAATARALGTADLDALTALDEERAAALQVSGRAGWQVLAGAAEGADLRGRLLRDEAPYGVGYFVAAWS
ncbi:class III extradiol dioxygenase subunit B-like domain-containing protein [Streptomyces sp. MCA2]|uniref:class III extradiol dioxygenase subunit B-like domain-containing protein n=1 Tax=Streptomyces sp. MCA2 TaxID=2944805 RepID=UPI002021A81D|nr:class III extradiol dioxygenase subunit B-like domain-containing protein [Streptomyces sp. MCA2]MCL7494741.1 class III extradiol dioxygenase subunit B-like domain-containing protein [Streptomyces sp. MCA2]